MQSDSRSDPHGWPTGEGATAALVRGHDWAATSLGDIPAWPQSLRTLVEFCLAFPLPSAILAGTEPLLIYNDACARLQGSQHPAALGAPAASAFPDSLINLGEVRDRLARGEPAVFRDRPWVSGTDGKLSTTRVDAVFTPVADETGAFAYSQVTILEASAGTGQLDAASAAQAEAPGAVWVLDPAAMRLDYASPGLERLLGAGRDAVTERFERWIDLVAADDQARLRDHIERSATGEDGTIAYRMATQPGGGDRHIKQTSFPIPSEHGGGVRVAAVVQDITDLDRAEAALRAEEMQYRTIAEGIPSLVWRSGHDGSWTWAGPQWLDYTGQTQEQSHGWGWLDAIHPDDRDLTLQSWHAAKPGDVLDIAYRIRRASDGCWRWHQTRSTPRVRSPDEQHGADDAVEWLGTSADVHDLRESQAKYEALVEDLRRQTTGLTTVAQALSGRS